MLALVVAGLSTGNKIGLAVVGAAFILFALVSSFVVPRRNPNFPGKNIGWYVAACVLFFVAMLAAVLVFGKEKAEPAGDRGTPAAETTTASTTASTPAPSTSGGGGGGGGGDAAAGKAVFTSAGCVSCHTLKDANAHGNVGPNLDQLKPDAATVKHQVEVGGGAMPAFKDQLSPKQIEDVAAYVASATGA
jgi:mono/diheme cytochrome c family protein